MRRSFHQTVRRRRGVEVAYGKQIVNSSKIAARKPCLTKHVIDVIPVALVSRNPTGGGVRLFDEAGLFQFPHHVSNCSGTPAVTMRKPIRQNPGADGFASDQVLLY